MCCKGESAHSIHWLWQLPQGVYVNVGGFPVWESPVFTYIIEVVVKFACHYDCCELSFAICTLSLSLSLSLSLFPVYTPPSLLLSPTLSTFLPLSSLSPPSLPPPLPPSLPPSPLTPSLPHPPQKSCKFLTTRGKLISRISW